ncbi:MAG: hypothetical protein CSA07_03460 [Bacteroidia bacterium]|nr:MAG: hypothetical protein CSA07_03460 [Bacteroidia bacterium]
MLTMAVMVLVAGGFVSCKDKKTNNQVENKEEAKVDPVGKWEADTYASEKGATGSIEKYKSMMPITGFELKEDKTVELTGPHTGKDHTHQFMWEEKEGKIHITAKVTKGQKDGSTGATSKPHGTNPHAEGLPKEIVLELEEGRLVWKMDTEKLMKMIEGMGKKGQGGHTNLAEVFGKQLSVIFIKK